MSEDRAEYDALLEDLLREMQPTTEHESLLVSLMVQARWKLARMVRLEADLFERMSSGEDVTNELELIHRYSGAAERSYFKAHKEFTDGRGVHPSPVAPPKPDPLAALKNWPVPKPTKQ